MNEQPSFRIAHVRTPNDLASVVRRFRAYPSSLDIDLSYQGFDAEVEAMPGKYAPPAGKLLLARDFQRHSGRLCWASAHRAPRLL